ncbi:MAG: ComEA family DNA-binding protein [Candidatus Delongbacteria bacterium]|nr:ComEA family DNA-binding protein [Candidatus Delongbacteria bacterium]
MLKLVFTPQEKRVLLFILATFLLGSGLRLISHYRLQSHMSQLDSLDRVFLERAKRLPQVSDDTPVSDESAATGVSGTAPLDINRASATELETLPGVGPVLAQRIVDWRQQQGPFLQEDDLLQVRGIGQRSLERLLPLIRVETKP